MANTEGIPDDDLRELLTLPPSPDLPKSSPSASPSPYSTSTSFSSARGPPRSDVGDHHAPSSPRQPPRGRRRPPPPSSRSARLARRDEAMRAQRERSGSSSASASTSSSASAIVASSSRPSSSSSSAATAAPVSSVPSVAEAEEKNDGNDEDSSSSSSRRFSPRRPGPSFRLHPSRARMMDEMPSPDASASAGGGGGAAARAVRGRGPAVRGARSSSSSSAGSAAAPAAPKLSSSSSKTTLSTGPRHEEEDGGDVPPALVRDDDDEHDAGGPSGRKQTKPVLISASVVERPVNRNDDRHRRGADPPSESRGGADGGVGSGRVSRFKQRQAARGSGGFGGMGDEGTPKFIGGTSGGFPSLDAPVGSLVRNKGGRRMKTNVKRSEGDVGSKNERNAATMAAAAAASARPLGATTSGRGGEDGGDAATAADRMIASMSPAEIREGVEEIASELSPETVAFLRERGRRKKEKKEEGASQAGTEKDGTNKKADAAGRRVKGDEATPEDDSTQMLASAPAATTKKTNIATMTAMAGRRDEAMAKARAGGGGDDPDVEVRSKERVAALLSSIRTEEELDEAYRRALADDEATAVASRQTTTVAAADGESGGLDTLEGAARLLRSTSSRQRLLAARAVCALLEDKARQRRRNRLRLGRDDGAAADPVDEYPDLLPVSVRCLLDVPSSSSGGGGGSGAMLQLYALRSLRALTERFAPSLGRSSDDDETDIYQSCYMDDAVPAAKFEPSAASPAAAASAAATPLDVPGAPGGALYSSDSSAESARKDGRAFYSDPAWTLLSRMRTLPALASIVSSAAASAASSTMSSATSVVASDESTESICALLGTMVTRSPGAATAIARHRTLLPELISVCLDPASSSRAAGGTAVGAPLLGAGGGSIAGGGPPAEAEEEKESKVEDIDAVVAANETPSSSFVVRPKRALVLLQLLCLVARQSRNAASATAVFGAAMPHLFAILSMGAESDIEYEVQRWALVLWRTLLRYGLAVPHVRTFLELSIFPRGPNADPRRYDLTAEYMSAFAQVCECAGVVTHSNGGNKVELTPQQREALAGAGMWLSSSVRGCAEGLALEFASGAGGGGGVDDDDDKVVELWRRSAARMGLIKSYASAAVPADVLGRLAPVDETEEEEEGTSPSPSSQLRPERFVEAVPREVCLSALGAVLLPSSPGGSGSGSLERALRTALGTSAFALDWDQVREVEVDAGDAGDAAGRWRRSLEREAAACAFVGSIASLLKALSSRDSKPQEESESSAEGTISALRSRFRSAVLEALAEAGAGAAAAATGSSSRSARTVHPARAGWLCGAHASLCRFLCASLSSPDDSLPSESGDPDIPLIRAFAFSLLGRLRPGDESTAAVLFSQDALFRTTTAVASGGEEFSAIVSSGEALQDMFLRELCRSDGAKAQLDHSFKLRGGRGLSAQTGSGPFSLSSLRSEADAAAAPAPKPKDDAEEGTDGGSVMPGAEGSPLPLGKLWLWQVLSGTVQSGGKKDTGVEFSGEDLASASAVVHACLSLLLTVEERDDDADDDKVTERARRGYVDRIDAGAKLYHLCNACMFPEQVLRDERLGTAFESLFQRYADASKDNVRVGRDFVDACARHSLTGRPKEARSRPVDRCSVANAPDDKVGKEGVLSLLEGSGANLSREEFAPHAVRSLSDFAGDLCDAFLEYGAQYPSPFVHCVRFLLRPGLPSRVRCDVLVRVRDLLRLLTLEAEAEDPAGSAIAEALRTGLSGGLPSRDGSRRDPPDFLDALAEVVLKGDDSRRPAIPSEGGGGYVCLLAVGYIGRNLASSFQKCACGLEASRRRLEGMDAGAAEHIALVAKKLLSSVNGSKDELVDAILNTVSESNDRTAKGGQSRSWEDIVASLRAGADCSDSTQNK